MSLTLVTAPTSYPLTLANVRVQTRREGYTDDDAYLQTFLIPAVVGRAEKATRRQVRSGAVYELRLPGFPCTGVIELPRPPLVSVTSVTYVDTAGDSQTLSSSTYIVDAPVGDACARGRIVQKTGQSWPATQAHPQAVVVRFVCGYTSVPPLLLQAMLMDAATLYVQRQTVITGASVAQLPGGVRDIYDSYRSYAQYPQ